MHSVSSYEYELLLFFDENKLFDRNSDFTLMSVLDTVEKVAN